MKALLIADTHWLWYAAGRWGNSNGLEKPRVDYMALRNHVSDFLINRFGNVYDLECCAFVANQRKQGNMSRFIDLLKGFGYRVDECIDPTPAMTAFLKDEFWDLAVLAIGSVEVLAACETARKDGRKVIAASFNGGSGQGITDAVLRLNKHVLYEGIRSRM